jgi:hypothetical protein
LVFDGKTNDLSRESLANLYGSQVGDIEMDDELSHSDEVKRPQLVLVN